MSGRKLNLYAFLLAVSGITYWHLKRCHSLPWPPQYIYAALVFVMLDVFSLFNEEIAGVTSVGFVLALFVNNKWTTNNPGCGNMGTGQPQETAFMGSSQSPTTASLVEFQQQLGGTPVNGPGTTQPAGGFQVV